MSRRIASTRNSGQGTENEIGEEEREEHPQKEPLSPSIAEDWVVKIEDKLKSSCHGDFPPNHSIFKVPNNLQETEQQAYIPQIVSIGPYHQGKKSLQELEGHKWRLLHHVLDNCREHSVKDYLKAMASLEKETRGCYSEPIKDMDSRAFVEMMLLDACFILEFLKVSVKGLKHSKYSSVDPLFSFRGTLPCIQRDMLLLENQLPLFVLDKLFDLTGDPDPNENNSVSKLALTFFASVIPGCQHHKAEEKKGLHLLDVVRQCLVPSTSKAKLKRSEPVHEQKEPQFELMMFSVSALRKAGVTFRKKNRSEKFTDIEFNKGVLYIPPLVIHHSTKCVFLNLMAFEHCCRSVDDHVTSYVRFMDGLINSPRDVGYLRDEGIIDHGLGSEEEVAFLFNNICRGFVLDINQCYLSHVSSDVKEYFHMKWHTWGASLKNDYFKNPWTVVSFLAAILLIGLTITQTLYGVLAFYSLPS